MSEPTMYTVGELAELAGVSIRTLRYYDQIGLLRPTERTESGYRLYGREEMLRLQQILFYRELEVPLEEIRSILSSPGFRMLEALERHRAALRARAHRTAVLIETVQNTIEEIREETNMLTDKDLYKGFSREEAEQYQAEARSSWPDEFTRVDQKVRNMSKERWEAIRREGDEVTRAIADVMVGETDPAVDSDVVQELVARHHGWIENFYEADADRYLGLATMYTDDERFRAFYEKYAPGLADFLAAAMKHYARKRL